jgi:GLPGLI family protein
MISAQPVFITKAKIEFERKTNLWASLPSSMDSYKKSIPQFKSDFFNYIFDNNKAIYQVGKESETKNMFSAPASDNTVFTDLSTGKYVAYKNVFEKSYLIEDSLRNATWKITGEIRDIAGFKCRRATTILFDSVFVVAFYTDEIMISGGPEGFHGLPGMILGLVINRLHTSWYATKVEVNSVNDNNITPPVKGKKITNAELLKILQGSLSMWGSYAERNIWAIMI